MIKKIHHIGIVVRDLDTSIAFYERMLGEKSGPVHEVAGGKARVAFIKVNEETKIELLEPHDATISLGKFLEQHGEGIHHFCFGVDDIDGDLQAMAEMGIDGADQKAADGPNNDKVAFVGPQKTNGVVIELIQGGT